jgi:hypothetical protein
MLAKVVRPRIRLRLRGKMWQADTVIPFRS